jgi:hypothetical protein
MPPIRLASGRSSAALNWNIAQLETNEFIALEFQVDEVALILDASIAILTLWRETWGYGANFVATQSFEWCFNRLILTQRRQLWPNVNPPIATLARGSFDWETMSSRSSSATDRHSGRFLA